MVVHLDLPKPSREPPPKPIDDLFREVGEAAVAIAKRAFAEQKSPAGEPWPEAYQGREPRIRIANLVGDLLEGRTPGPNVFTGRPAGVYTGDLQRSIGYVASVLGNRWTFDVQGWVPYAESFQAGGARTQPVTPAVKQRLGQWLDSLDSDGQRRARTDLRSQRQRRKAAIEAMGQVKTQNRFFRGIQMAALRVKKSRADKAIARRRAELQDARSNPYRKAVGFLFGVNSLTTHAVGRSFEVDQSAKDELQPIIDRYFADAGEGEGE